MEYGIADQGLPVIVVYPGIEPIDSRGNLTHQALSLWDKLPAFRDNMHLVPTLHIPMEKGSIRIGLSSENYMVQSKTAAGRYSL